MPDPLTLDSQLNQAVEARLLAHHDLILNEVKTELRQHRQELAKAATKEIVPRLEGRDRQVISEMVAPLIAQVDRLSSLLREQDERAEARERRQIAEAVKLTEGRFALIEQQVESLPRDLPAPVVNNNVDLVLVINLLHELMTRLDSLISGLLQPRKKRVRIERADGTFAEGEIEG